MKKYKIFSKFLFLGQDFVKKVFSQGQGFLMKNSVAHWLAWEGDGNRSNWHTHNK